MKASHNGSDLSLQERSSRRPNMRIGPQINDRFAVFLRILGQQGILRFDQAQRFLGLLSPQPDKMKQPGILSAERTRKLLRPWIDEGVLLYRAFYVRQKGVYWLTSKGYKYAQLNLRYYEPTPSSLPHLLAINDVRLTIAQRRPKDIWRSEREIRAQQQQTYQKGATPPHVPDAELLGSDGSIRAIEVELTIKSEKRLQEIVSDLAANQHYTAILYFAPENVCTVVGKALQTLSSDARKRFTLYRL